MNQNATSTYSLIVSPTASVSQTTMIDQQYQATVGPIDLVNDASSQSGLPAAVSNAAATQSCDPANIDCSRLGCLSKCGILDGFENLTNCNVNLEISTQRGPKADNSDGADTQWTLLLPTFRPGGVYSSRNAAAYFPESTQFRVVHALSGQVLQSYGAIGTGRRTLVLDAGSCSSIVHGGDDDIDTTFRNTDFQKLGCYAGTSGASGIGEAVLTLALAVIAVGTMVGVLAVWSPSTFKSSASPSFSTSFSTPFSL